MTDTHAIAGYDDAPGAEGGEGAVIDSDGQVPPSSAPELKSLLGVIVATLVVAALYFGKEVLLPITLSVILSFVLSPVVNALQRFKLWRAPAVIITVIGALLALALVGTVIGSQTASLAAKAPEYARTIETKVQGVQGFAIEKLGSISRQFSGAGKPAGPPVLSGEPATASGRVPVPVEVVAESTSPLTIVRTVLAPVLGPLETIALVFIVAIFILMQKEDLRDRFIRLFGSSDLHRTTRAIDDAGKRLSKYFLSQLAVNTSFGIVIALGLWAIGIPAPAMWGLLAGILRFVPYIGPLLAAVAPAALGAAVDPGWAMTIEVVVLFFVVEPLTGYVVEPLLYGHSTGLSPISVIVAAIFWTWAWGPIGLIISTPLTLCLVVTGRHVKRLEFFDILLGDRPALTPVESFYQRILADNPDEALAQAETMLAERSVIDYYDDVVIPALRLAADDAARGPVDRAQARRMRHAVRSVIDDLARRTDANAIEERSQLEGRSVLCITGRSLFDPLVTKMLAQSIVRRGGSARTALFTAASRQEISSLDLSGVKVIVVTYLDLVGSPAEVRYLIKRLRDRAPSVSVVVGLWAIGEKALMDEGRLALGADACSATMRDTIAAVSGETPLASAA